MSNIIEFEKLKQKHEDTKDIIDKLEMDIVDLKNVFLTTVKDTNLNILDAFLEKIINLEKEKEKQDKLYNNLTEQIENFIVEDEIETTEDFKKKYHLEYLILGGTITKDNFTAILGCIDNIDGYGFKKSDKATTLITKYNMKWYRPCKELEAKLPKNGIIKMSQNDYINILSRDDILSNLSPIEFDKIKHDFIHNSICITHKKYEFMILKEIK